MNYQQAALVATDFQLQRAEGQRPRFVGYASLFNTPSAPLPYTEVIAPGAFKRSLSSKGRTFALVLDHNDRMQVATTRAGNLTLQEDSRGLLVEATLPDTSVARDLMGYHDAGEVRGMSFTFKPEPAKDTRGPAGELQRNVLNLGHVTALVSMDPAYGETGPTVQIRALAEQLQAEADDIETLLDGIREGRALADAEVALLSRLATHYQPTEAEHVEETRTDDADFLASMKERIAALAAEK